MASRSQHQYRLQRGPQFDPKDIDYLEVQRGGYNAEYGDRTYGVFNVVTRSGFERNRQGELVTSYGNYNNTTTSLALVTTPSALPITAAFRLSHRSWPGNTNSTHSSTISPPAAVSRRLSLTRRLATNCVSSPACVATITRFRTIPVSQTKTASGRATTSKMSVTTFFNFSWLHTMTAGTADGLPFYHFNRAHYVGDSPRPSELHVPE